MSETKLHFKDGGKFKLVDPERAALIANAPAMYNLLEKCSKSLDLIALNSPPNMVGFDMLKREILQVLAAARGENNQKAAE